jgi:hypothetical protein
MNDVFVGVTSFFLGFGAATMVWAGIVRRLTVRLLARNGLVRSTVDLETRRVAYDSGRDTLIRSNAGAPGKVVEGMRTRPGSLAKYLTNKGLL